MSDWIDGLRKTVWSCDSVFNARAIDKAVARKLLPIIDEAAYQANACLQFLETPPIKNSTDADDLPQLGTGEE